MVLDMRLIDADELRNDLLRKSFYPAMVAASIEKAPVVNPYEWISVKDNPPEKFEYVLCFFPDKKYGSKIEADYAETDHGHFANQFKWGEPSHWMPLPTLPTEKDV